MSHPIEEQKAKVLSSLLPDIRIEVYEGLHHFNPPQWAEPERFARALRELWTHSEVAASVNGWLQSTRFTSLVLIGTAVRHL